MIYINYIIQTRDMYNFYVNIIVIYNCYNIKNHISALIGTIFILIYSFYKIYKIYVSQNILNVEYSLYLYTRFKFLS